MRIGLSGMESAVSPAMAKSRKSRKSRKAPTDRSATTDVMTQLACAIRNPQATLLGAIVGGLVPWFGRTLAHDEIPNTWHAGSPELAIAMVAIVLGCACFSALSVYKFGRAAFGDSRKAFGFVLALEGVMVVSHGATSNVALAVLIGLNAIANGSVIALARDATRRRQEADARRSATRARNRAAAAPPSGPPSDTPSRPVRERVVSQWRRPSMSEVIDAEIVSDTKLLLS